MKVGHPNALHFNNLADYVEVLQVYANQPSLVHLIGLSWPQAYIYYATLVGSRNHLGGSDCQSVAPGPTASTSPRNRLEMYLIRYQPRTIDQNLWEWGPGIWVLSSHPGDSPA